MFKIRDSLFFSGVFNETVIKRFEETWDPKSSSRLWMIPGHVVYTTSHGQKVYTCDARPFDLPSVSETECSELTVTVSPVLDIFFETERASSRMYIVLCNGDIHIFEYRVLLYEWARVGYFNVNIVSPNNSDPLHSTVHKVFISQIQNTIFWCEKTGTSDEMCFNLYRRTLPPDGVREITQSAVGPPLILLRNCPDIELLDIGDNICIVPQLPNSINIYIILSARSHLWLFDISGKCLWRSIVTDYPVDFLTLCIKTAGLWSQTGSIKACKLLNFDTSRAYILHNQTVLTVMSNGEICKKTVCSELTFDAAHDYYVLHNILCIFTGTSLNIYNIESGQLIQVIDLTKYMPIRGTWYHISSLPAVGFYSDTAIQQLHYRSLNSIFNSDVLCYSQILSILTQENFHLLALLKDLMHHNFTISDILPLQNIPIVLQSKALLLAILQTCREKGFNFENFALKDSEMDVILSSQQNDMYPETKLKKMLQTLVDCFCLIEREKFKT